MKAARKYPSHILYVYSSFFIQLTRLSPLPYILSTRRFLCRNSETGELGSTITISQGRLPNNLQNDIVYVNGVVELVSKGVMTPAEIRKHWSLLKKDGQPRTNAAAWRDFLNRKKKAYPMVEFHISTNPRQTNVDAYKQLQSAILRRFAP